MRLIALILMFLLILVVYSVGWNDSVKAVKEQVNVNLQKAALNNDTITTTVNGKTYYWILITDSIKKSNHD